MKAPLAGVFRSLRSLSSWVWVGGAFVSNVGTWMQRDGPGLAGVHPTHPSTTPSAVGMVMALQFGPQFLLLPWTGFAADIFDRRKLLIATQATMGALRSRTGAAHRRRPRPALARLHLRLPVRQCRGVRCAGPPDLRRRTGRAMTDLPNAVALNSTSFNAARMIGPAVAGLLIAGVGTGWAFIINGACRSAAVLMLPHVPARRRAASECRAPHRARAASSKASATSGAARTSRRFWLMLFLIGTFGMNFPIFISTMAVTCIPCRRRRIWPADVDDGDRHDDGRAVARRPGQAAVRACCCPARGLRARLHAGGDCADLLVLRPARSSSSGWPP